MPVLSENLIAYYECDAASPTSDSWGSNTATLYSISSQTGQFNEAWGFSNSYDSVTLSGTPNVGTYSISGWVYNARHTGDAVFSSNGASFTSEWFHMYINGSGELGALNYSTFTGSGYTVPSLSGWHHFAVTRDSGGNVKFYIDGAQVGATVTPAFSGDFSVQIIGSDPGGTDYRWGERLDDYAIWNRTLDASEITIVYNEGNAGNSLRSLIGPSTLRGQFASVVHTVASENGRLHGMFGSVVHTVNAENGRLHGMFASVVHSIPTPAAIVPDITGSPGAPATFDGSASVLVEYYKWSWVSVPGGSPLRAPFDNSPIPFPDNQATSPIDMTNNEGLWHFEGNADDTSGNGNNGTVNGATLVTGKVGSQAYQFDGSNDYITAPSSLSLQIAGDISISAWIKVDSYSTYESIIQYSNSGESEANNHLYNVTWANAGGDIRLFWEYGGGSNVITDFNTNLNTGQWYHIVVVRDASELKAHLYVDGTLFDSKTYSNNPTGGTTSQLWIGTDGGSGGYFDGTIDEVAIWSRTLSASEVSAIYALQNGGLAGIGTSTFTFTPDIVGTYTINLAIDGSTNTDADCVVTVPGGGGSEPQGHATQGGNLQGRRTQGLL